LQHPWVENAIWTTFFTKAKSTLPPEKGIFCVFWKLGGGAFPPGSYAPASVEMLLNY
jgi:hypothetical protein